MKKIISIDGMFCSHCTSNVEKALKAVPGVSEVTVDLAAKNATVEAEESVDDEALKTAVDDLGFVVKGIA